MNAHAVGLRDRYRSRGILVDANLLLLLFIGHFDRRQIAQHKRTRTFTVEDFKILFGFVDQFDRMITTPNILSEVSNLSGQMGEPARSKCFKHFAAHIGLLAGKGFLTEQYVVSAEAVKLEQFPKLGLTDSGIFQLVKGKYLVLTADWELHGILEHHGIDSINFNHLRPF